MADHTSPDDERPKARRARTSSGVKGRHRLGVLGVLLLSLFATLFSRMYYLQVATSADYQAKAADQSVRDIVEQPARGLIVDDQGVPLVANRTAWTVTIDRTLLGRLEVTTRERLLRRISRAVGRPYGDVAARTLLCGQPGAVAGKCWNGSPYQPVPVASDIAQATAVTIMEQNEDFPAVIVEPANVRSYPSPYGINLAHVLGYLSPITGEELDVAQADDDTTLHGASAVGRAGLERTYDRELRGVPGYTSVSVDSQGRVLGDASVTAGTVGNTLVTSLDAKVQSVVERELAETIKTARATRDEVTGRNYVADSGSVVVLETQTGRVVAMASQPTYDPAVWVGGISNAELDRLYSERAGTPLLSRATQGQFAPGSTWKPFMTAGALKAGYSQSSQLNCSSSVRVGNRDFKNYESGAYGFIGFQRALEVSCNTFFYRIGYDFWQRWGSDVADVDARDPLVEEAKEFGFGSETGIDLPGEASGRIADRAWKRDYYKQMRDYYCAEGEKPGFDFLQRFAREFCVEGFAYRAGDAVNFAIGQGDTIVTPLQLARAYAAIGNGGTLYEPRVVKAVVGPTGKVLSTIKPVVQAKIDVPQTDLGFIDVGLQGVARVGTMSWRLGGFPLDQVTMRAKTGSAEVYGKQSTSWVASYTPDYTVVMMVSQGGTGSGTSGPSVRRIYEALYGIEADKVVPAKAAIPGTTPAKALPVFSKDGSILPPAVSRSRR